MIRTVIIDRLSLARQRLAALLSKESDISIVCANDGGTDLGEIMRSVQPELMFLDIGLAEAGRFKAIATAPVVERPQIVFVTEFEHFAVHAFAMGATDYLLKPVASRRLQLCLSRVRRHPGRSPLPAPPAPAVAGGGAQPAVSHLTVPRRIAIRSGKKRFLLSLDNIEWCEAAGNYVIFHVAKEQHMVRAAIGELPGMLDPHQFLRISKSTVVNVEQVSSLEQIGAGDLELVLANGTRHIVGRVFRNGLEDRLRSLGGVTSV